MRTKEEMSKSINDKLGTDLDWSEMKKDDLELFEELIDDGAFLEKLAKLHVKNKSSEKVEETIDDWEPGQIVYKLL